MKNAVLVLNAVLLVAVGVLFYLHFSSDKKGGETVIKGTSKADTTSGASRIAYFELDSVTNAYAMVKDVKNELSKEEEKINVEMSKLQKNYNDRLNYYQNQGEMSQVQSEEASKEMMRMQEQIRDRKQRLDQDFQNTYMRKMQEVRTEIEKFLKEYNKTRNFTYILANEPQIIYFRDTAYDITADLLKGLNELYSKKK